MRPLTERQAARCENAVHSRCRCRCGGRLHGAQRAFEFLAPDDPHFVSREKTKGNFPEHAPAERVIKVRPRTLNRGATSVPTDDSLGMRRGPLAGDGRCVLRKVFLPPFRISQLARQPRPRGGKTAIFSAMEFALALAVALNEADRTAFTDADFRSRADLSIATLALDRNETERNVYPSFARSRFRSPRLDRWQGGKEARGFPLPAREGARKAARFLRGLSERKP
jgi:hypothetical protein